MGYKYLEEKMKKSTFDIMNDNILHRNESVAFINDLNELKINAMADEEVKAKEDEQRLIAEQEEKEEKMMNSHSTNAIPDHLLPAAHENGMDNDELQRQIYSKAPPNLVTPQSIKYRKEKEKEAERMREAMEAKAFRLAIEEKQRMLLKEAE